MRRFEAVSAGHVAGGGPCSECVAWEIDPVGADRRTVDPMARRALKEAWLDRVVAEYGGVGWVDVVDGRQRGHIVYVPSIVVPRLDAFPTAPATPDALVVIGLWADEPAGFKPLVQRAVKDLRGRGIAALEAFGGGAAPRGCLTRPADGRVPCRLPDALLARLGFHVVRAHPQTARYRLEVGSAVPGVDVIEHGVASIGRALRPTPARRPTLGRTDPGMRRDGAAPHLGLAASGGHDGARPTDGGTGTAVGDQPM